MKTKTSFFNRAKDHQQKYRENILELSEYDTYVTMLKDEDASKGGNFYIKWNGMLEAVENRYKGFRKPLYKNMLRSEHIPFNFFVPLQNNNNDELTVQFFSQLTGIPGIINIEGIDFEKSPEKKKYLPQTKNYAPLKEDEKFLDDRTSFDVMVTYESERGLGAIGIEVKYTEKSYPYGETEKSRMESEDENELYQQTHNRSGIYIPGAIKKLRSKTMKQFWRNHLLGLKMIQKGLVKEFTSIQLFPKSNTYQYDKSQEYHDQIIDTAKTQFVPITYEQFIATGLETFKGKSEFEDWLNYLQDRYIVAA